MSISTRSWTRARQLGAVAGLILLFVVQGTWAQEPLLTPADEGIVYLQEPRSSLGEADRVSLPIGLSAAQIERTVTLESDSPVTGSCRPSDGRIQFEGETRSGRLCATQYTFDVPSTADGVLFTLDKAMGNVDVILVASFGRPLTEAQQVSISRSEEEEITNIEGLACVRPRCPVGPEGTWFIGVINFTSEPQEYTIAASITPVALQSGETRRGTIEGVSPGFGGTLGFVDYTIRVPQEATRLRIELESTTGGNIDLAARFDSPVTVNQQQQLVRDYLADSVEGIEVLTIDASSTPPLRAGTYHMSVINREPRRQNFVITATVFPREGDPPQPGRGSRSIQSASASRPRRAASTRSPRCSASPRRAGGRSTGRS